MLHLRPPHTCHRRCSLCLNRQRRTGQSRRERRRNPTAYPMALVGPPALNIDINDKEWRVPEIASRQFVDLLVAGPVGSTPEWVRIVDSAHIGGFRHSRNTYEVRPIPVGEFKNKIQQLSNKGERLQSVIPDQVLELIAHGKQRAVKKRL